MRHRIIKDIFTIIYKGRQLVGFEVDGLDKYIFLSPERVLQCTKVQINEVEILIGSKFRPVFYQEGEKLLNGKIYEKNNLIIKEFWIECIGSIEEMHNRNKNKLKPLKVIQKVFQFHKNGKDVVGFDTGEHKATFIETTRLQGLTRLEPSEFHILEGSYINPEYYQEGEKLNGGGTCFKSGVILKALNLRYYGNIEKMHERFEKVETNYSMGNYYNHTNDDGYDNNDWLIDAAGSDDPETMSDAYWNMD